MMTMQEDMIFCRAIGPIPHTNHSFPVSGQCSHHPTTKQRWVVYITAKRFLAQLVNHVVA